MNRQSARERVVPSAARAGSPSIALRTVTVAALLALVLVAFGGVVRNDWFAIDDNRYVLDNPHVRTGLTLANVRWELTHFDCGNYHPLTMLSHMLDVRLFGLQPAGPHAVSLGWHALDAILLLLVLHGFTGAWWRSACVAALFAVHPLRVESVAWIAERKDVLSTCFFLLTLDAWRRWTRQPGAGRYALACAWLTLGLLAKPMLITTPFVLLLLDAWPLGRLELSPGAAARGHALWDRVREKWPLWLLVGAFSTLTLRTQGGAGALTLIPGLTLALRASNALRTYWIYVRQSVWPHDLVAFVPHDLQPHALAAALSALALVAVTIAVLRVPRRPWLATGWLWYVGTLLPVINLVQVGPHARADRFTYVPGIGLAILLVWELGARVERLRAARVIAVAAMLAAIAGLALATSRQVALWSNSRTMYEAILRVYPGQGSNIIRWGLADIDLREGHPTAALSAFERLERDMPRNTLLQTETAQALAALGRLPEAREHLANVVARAPSAEAWRDLARVDEQIGDSPAAMAGLDSALVWAPEDAAAHADLALLLVNAGRIDDALVHLARAVELSPASVEYRRALAETLKRRARYKESLAQYESIAGQAPDDLNALLNAAWMRATLRDAALRDGAAAVRTAEHALALAPSPQAALVATAAAAYAEVGRWDDAIAAADRAVALARAAGSHAEAAEYAAQGTAYRSHKAWRGTPK